MKWRTTSPANFTYLTAATLTPAHEILVCGQNGRLLRSRDAGESWEVVKALKKPFFTAVCATPDGGIIVGDWKGNVQVSRDDGASFAGYKLRGVHNIQSIATNGRSVVALGRAAIAWADVGSDAWTPAKGITKDLWLQALCVADDGAYWACGMTATGYHGRVLVSRDDGRSFSPVAVDDTDAFIAIAVHGQRVYLCTSKNAVLWSEDGGATFARTEVSATGGGGLEALALAGDTVFIGGRYEPEIQRSDDAGKSFRSVDGARCETLLVVPVGRVIAVGTQGISVADAFELAGTVEWPEAAGAGAAKSAASGASVLATEPTHGAGDGAGQAASGAERAASDPWADALAELLVLWRATRAPEVAELVLKVGARVTPVHARDLDSLSDVALHTRWIAAAQHGRAEDVSALLAHLLRGVTTDVEQRVKALEKFPDDPRIAAALADFVARFHYAATSSKPIWTAAFKLLERTADPRAASVVSAASKGAIPVSGASMRGWLTGVLPKAASAIDAAVTKAARPVDATGQALCKRVEGTLAT